MLAEMNYFDENLGDQKHISINEWINEMKVSTYKFATQIDLRNCRLTDFIDKFASISTAIEISTPTLQYISQQYCSKIKRAVVADPASNLFAFHRPKGEFCTLPSWANAISNIRLFQGASIKVFIYLMTLLLS